MAYMREMVSVHELRKGNKMAVTSSHFCYSSGIRFTSCTSFPHSLVLPTTDENLSKLQRSSIKFRLILAVKSRQCNG